MIEVDAAQVLEYMGAVYARMLAPEPVLAAVGAIEVEAARERITDTKTNPWGGDWAAWADSTEYQRTRKGNADQGLLWDRGDLLESIHFQVDGPSVAIGSDLDYAVYLQLGTERMPARPFLGWTPEGITAHELRIAHFFDTGAIA
jgi:phage gpG-like protein